MDDSTKEPDQETHASAVDRLAHDSSGVHTSDSIPILTQNRKAQHLSQDAIQSLEAMTKTKNLDIPHRFLNILSSPEPGQSYATSEELDDRDSSQTPDSDESSSTTNTYIDYRKSQVIDRIVFTVMQWLHLKLDVWRKNAGGNSNSASGTSEALSGSNLRSVSSCPNNRGNKKRKAAERDDQETDNEDEDRNREDPQSSRMPSQGHEDPKFACPYFKYNPAKYKDWRTCPGPGWNDVHRVKEHLYRRHRQPQYRCARCWQPFTDEQRVMDHQRTDDPCPLREMEYVEGFDAAQERSLRSRKRANQKLTETEKWRRVFNILFPHILGDDIPSPFYDYSQVTQKEDDCHTESGYLAQCEQYMLREVPQRLRQALGRELDRDMTIVEENLRRRAGDWVKTLLEEAFQELRQIRRLGSPTQQPEPSNDIPAPAEGGQPSISELHSIEGANLCFDGEGETWLDTFDFDTFHPSSILEELQSPFGNGGLIEGLLRPGEADAGEASKQSDSGYVSNSPE
ncbi:Nicotinate-nucleotide diphosphorylase [Fusarium pseudocircinatum]|uniref:Nicotinate-nucleotide diphosphorylase n=1 Tax=Fusarium pseudocircinatum TaxID=56676 RepID=A0A8H5KZ31_9HYPO|nr:Nicotinate-nucleotide diphosphorylase [Fusarium pseudocircinatum]